MTIVLDIVELQNDIVFVTGYVDQSLAVGDPLKSLIVFQPAKKRKQSPKRISSIDTALTVKTILIDGEPLDSITSNTTAQIGLVGNITALMDLVESHHWHERNGRYHLPRDETRLITLSGD